MRQLKFRLLDEKERVVGYEKWYVGAFNSESQKDYYMANPCWLYSRDGDKWNPEPIKHRYKNQHVGLLDKNSVEIYEGDIVQKYTTTGGKEYKYLRPFAVEWHTKRIQNGWNVSQGAKHLEVIGNIYSNPELL